MNQFIQELGEDYKLDNYRIKKMLLFLRYHLFVRNWSVHIVERNPEKCILPMKEKFRIYLCKTRKQFCWLKQEGCSALIVYTTEKLFLKDIALLIVKARSRFFIQIISLCPHFTSATLQSPYIPFTVRLQSGNKLRQCDDSNCAFWKNSL